MATLMKRRRSNEEGTLASSSPAQDNGLDINCLEMSGEVSPLDWGQAVRAATARLQDGWELPGTNCHLAMAASSVSSAPLTPPFAAAVALVALGLVLVNRPRSAL